MHSERDIHTDAISALAGSGQFLLALAFPRPHRHHAFRRVRGSHRTFRPKPVIPTCECSGEVRACGAGRLNIGGGVDSVGGNKCPDTKSAVPQQNGKFCPDRT